MDALLILRATFSAIQKVRDAVHGAKANKAKSQRLGQRIEMLTAQLNKLEQNSHLLSTATVAVVQNIKDFMEEEVLPTISRYTTQNYFQKLLQVDSSQNAFADLSLEISNYINHLVLALQTDHGEGHESIVASIQQIGKEMKTSLTKENQHDHVMDINSAEEHFASIEGDLGSIKSLLADNFEEQQAQLVSMRRRLSEVQHQHRSGSSRGSVHGSSSHLEAVLMRAINEIQSSSSASTEGAGDHGSSGVKWTTNFDDLTLGREIGRGGFGIVYEGVWQGIDVAIKQLLVNELTPAAQREFQKEMALMRDLQHPNVVRLYTACIDPPNLVMVMELCKNGSLFKLIHSEDAPLTWRDKTKLIYEISLGMRFLHGSKPAVLHRDFKSLNVLIDDNLHPKIADFGLSRVKTETRTKTMSEAGGTIAWSAPEILNGESYTEKADVYSFAITAWEVCSGAVPWAGKMDQVVIRLVCDKDQRPEFPVDSPPRLQTLLESCWRSDPFKRPDFVSISRKLRQILDVMGEPAPEPFVEEDLVVEEKIVEPVMSTKETKDKVSFDPVPIKKTVQPIQPDQPVPSPVIHQPVPSPVIHQPVPSPVQQVPPQPITAVKLEPLEVGGREPERIDGHPPPPLSSSKLLALQMGTVFDMAPASLAKFVSIVDSIHGGINGLGYLMLFTYFGPVFFFLPALIIGAMLTFLSVLVFVVALLPVFRFIRRLHAYVLNPRCDTDFHGFVSVFPPESLDSASLWDHRRVWAWVKRFGVENYTWAARKGFFRFLETVLEKSLLNFFKYLSILIVVPLIFVSFLIVAILQPLIAVIEDLVFMMMYLIGHLTRQIICMLIPNFASLRTTGTPDIESNRVSMLEECRWWVSFITGTEVVPLVLMDAAESLYNAVSETVELMMMPIRMLLCMVAHIVICSMDPLLRALSTLMYVWAVAGGQFLHPILMLLGYQGLSPSDRTGKEPVVEADLSDPWNCSVNEDDIVAPSTALDYLEFYYREVYAKPRFAKYIRFATKYIHTAFRWMCFPFTSLFSLMSSIAVGAALGLPTYFLMPFVPALSAMRAMLTNVLCYSSSYDPLVAMVPAADVRSQRRLVVKRLMMLVYGAVRHKKFAMVCGQIALYGSKLVATIFCLPYFLMIFPAMIATGMMASLFPLVTSVTFLAHTAMLHARNLQSALGGSVSAMLDPYKFAVVDIKPINRRMDAGWEEMESFLGYGPRFLLSDGVMGALKSTYQGSYSAFQYIVWIPMWPLTCMLILANAFADALVSPVMILMSTMVAIPLSVAMMLVGLLTGYEGLARLRRRDASSVDKFEEMNKVVVETVETASMQPIIPSSLAVAGSTTAMVVDGRLYTCGDAPLGNKSMTANDKQPGQVAALRQGLMASIEGGLSSPSTKVFYAISTAGQLSYWGTPPSLPQKLIPTPLLELDGHPVCKVSHGLDHSLVLMADARVFVLDKFGLKHIDRLPSIIDVAAGATFSVAIDIDGRAWTWGKAKMPSILGHGSRSVSKPKQLDFDGPKILRVAAGVSHTVFLTRDGLVMTMGEGKNGELGHGTRKSESLPRIIEALKDVSIVQIATTADSSDPYSLLLSNTGDVYVLGGKMASTLSGSVVFMPVKLDLPESARVSAVAAGASYALLQTQRGSVIKLVPELWSQGLPVITPPPVQVYQGCRGPNSWTIEERTAWLGVVGVSAAGIKLLTRIAATPAAFLSLDHHALSKEGASRGDADKILSVVSTLRVADGWRIRADVDDDARRRAASGVVDPGMVAFPSLSDSHPDVIMLIPGMELVTAQVTGFVADYFKNVDVPMPFEKLSVAVMPVAPGQTLIEVGLNSKT